MENLKGTIMQLMFNKKVLNDCYYKACHINVHNVLQDPFLWNTYEYLYVFIYERRF
jgi:hypothetical protein